MAKKYQRIYRYYISLGVSGAMPVAVCLALGSDTPGELAHILWWERILDGQASAGPM